VPLTVPETGQATSIVAIPFSFASITISGEISWQMKIGGSAITIFFLTVDFHKEAGDKCVGPNLFYPDLLPGWDIND
jgi:hypothetical protein